MDTRAKIARILIIDDDELVRDTISDVLEEAGHQVSSASNGRSGMDAILRDRPDLVICDVRMPKLNGYEVLKELRKGHPEVSGIPFIFLTGLSEKKYVMAGYKIGADDFMAKPIDNDLLRMKVAAIIRHSCRTETSSTPNSVIASGPNNEVIWSQGNKVTDDFQAMLVDPAKKNISAGSVRLVSLDEFKSAFGDQWEKVRDEAMDTAESVIRQNTRPSDVISRHGQDGFLLLCNDIEEDALSKLIISLMEKIKKRLLGEDMENYKNLSIAVDVLDATQLDQDGMTVEKLDAAFKQSAASQVAIESAGPMPNNLEIFKKQISIYYQPIWSPAKQAVIAFRCYPKRRTPNGVLHGPSVLYEGADDPWAVHLDMIMVDAVKGILLDPQRYGSVARLSLPIHYGSVAGENGLKINSALQSLPPSMLRKRTMLEIIGNPADRSEALMKQATRFALNYGGHVSFELAPDDIHVDILEESHVKMLQYEVPAADPFVKDQSHLLEIRRRGKMLAKAGIAGRIHNLNMLAQVQAARQSGYSLLAGRAIGHSEETPSQPYPLTEAKILGI